MNKKKILIYISIGVGISMNTSAQVGVNTESPKATLDVVALPNEPSAIDGLIAPRLSGSQLQQKNSLYTSDQKGAIVYAESKSPGAGIITDKTRNIDIPGYYYFDGNVWLPMGSTKPSASNGLTANETSGEIKLGGSLTEPTNISSITSQNNLTFTATGINAINLANNALSIDATNKRVGIGTSSPTNTLDIEGTLRLSQNIAANKPNILNANTTTVYIDTSNGSLYYGSRGAAKASGGFRPGINFLITTLRTNSTIVRVRFTCHINQSNETNNSDTSSYAYGDLTIVGMGLANPIKFVEVNIKDYQGNPKDLTYQDDTTLKWYNGPQGLTTLTINQTTGEFRVQNGTPVMSYVFEILGGL